MRPAIIKKEKQVNELKEKLTKISSAIVMDFRGLTVKEMTDLRRQLKTANIDYKIIKNNLMFRAVNESDLKALHPYLQGPTAVAFGLDDPTVPVKILINFIKEYKKLEIKAGIIQGRVFNAEELTQISKLPSKEILLAQFIGGIQAPLAGLVNVLSGTIRGLLNVLKAIEEKK
ncbi:MAG: 50S ribosomal protein L10 [bacterium]|nr:50S ribosomal protein L10 [bacterium]